MVCNKSAGFEFMSLPPLADGRQTDWHLAAHVDQLPARGQIDIIAEGVRLHITNHDSGVTARSDRRSYPVMVVDGEIFVLLSDERD
jgi:hypothetical protein